MHTDHVYVNITLSIDDRVIQEARRRAEAMGTSVNQLVREYLERFIATPGVLAAATGFECILRGDGGNSRGWHFNREDLHRR